MKFAAIIATQRTGTTVLRSVIDSHPRVKAFGEVFLDRHEHMKECYYHFLRDKVREDANNCIPSEDRLESLFNAYLDDYLPSLAGDVDMVLFDCKYNFLSGALVPGSLALRQAPFLLTLMRRRGVRLIHLLRENLLATQVSAILSSENRVWATTDLNRIKKRSTVVPLQGLMQNLQARRAEQEHYKALLRGDDVLTVKYEDLFGGDTVPADLLARISGHLGLSNDFEAAPPLKKIALSVRESIENYDEVAAHLRGTEFADLLPE